MMPKPASVQPVYTSHLLAALAVLTLAALLFPHDTAIFHSLRSFSNRAGQFHVIREVLELFRPCGQGEVILLIAAGMGLCGARRRALHILIALAVMTALIWPLKIAVGRERPAFQNFHSFPSGDAATAAAFVTPLISASPGLLPAAVLITGGVAMERIYYGRHYASDAAAGIAIGILSSAIALAILRHWRWRPKRSWFAMTGVILLVAACAAQCRTHAGSYFFLVLRIWGPLGLFLLVTNLIPAWSRKHNPTPRLPPACSDAKTAGSRLIFTACLTAGMLCLILPWVFPIFGLRIPLAVIGLIFLLMSHAATRRQGRTGRIPSLQTILTGMACIILSIGVSLFPAIQAFKASALTF